MSEMDDKAARIDPGEIRYIKLGAGGAWEGASLDGGRIDWGIPNNPHDLARADDWTAAKQFYIDHGVAPATATGFVRELREFHTLWGGELPPFDSMDDVNELIGILINGLWNDLTKHLKRSTPFRLVRPTLEPTAIDLGRYALIRQQELEGFVEGLFNGKDRMDLPQRAHEALGRLGELRAMMACICDLVARDVKAESRTTLETTFKHVRELTRIMEHEIHEAALSCMGVRQQMLDIAAANPA